MRKAPLLLGVVLILAACGSGTAETTSTTTTSITAPTTTSTTVPATTTTTQGTTTTLDPEVWSTNEIAGFTWDEGWQAARTDLRLTRYGFFVVEIADAPDHYAPILRSDDDRATWVSLLTEHDFLEATEVTETEVGGLPATTMWVNLPGDSGAPEPEWCGEPCVVFFDVPGYGWAIPEATPQRIWVIEREGGSLVVFTESLVDEHEAWATTVEE